MPGAEWSILIFRKDKNQIHLANKRNAKISCYTEFWSCLIFRALNVLGLWLTRYQIHIMAKKKKSCTDFKNFYSKTNLSSSSLFSWTYWTAHELVFLLGHVCKGLHFYPVISVPEDRRMMHYYLVPGRCWWTVTYFLNPKAWLRTSRVHPIIA